MKVYLAAQYHRKEEIRKYADDLRHIGHEVTSSWLEEPHAPTTQLIDLTDQQHRDYAIQDIVDIVQADSLVFFSVPDTELTVRGGRHVEFGYALARGIPIIVVGPKENIFHYLKGIQHVQNWTEALPIFARIREDEFSDGLLFTPKD